MGINSHSILAQIGDDGHVPGFGQGDGEAGRGGTGTDDGGLQAAGFVDHLAADTAA